MTIQARWNIQHGIIENRDYEWTNYSVEDEIDSYILAKIEIRNKYGNSNRIILDESAYDTIINNVEKNIEKAIDDLLKGFSQ